MPSRHRQPGRRALEERAQQTWLRGHPLACSLLKEESNEKTTEKSTEEEHWRRALERSTGEEHWRRAREKSTGEEHWRRALRISLKKSTETSTEEEH